MRLIAALSEKGVKFIIAGGFAGNLHGAAKVTYDLDILYERSAENLNALSESLAPIHPYLRGAPPGLPFVFDALTLQRGLNFTLTTDAGDIDLLGELDGLGDYQAGRNSAVERQIFGHRCLCLGLDELIRTKRAAGRPKDFEALAELEALRDELRRKDSC